MVGWDGRKFKLCGGKGEDGSRFKLLSVVGGVMYANILGRGIAMNGGKFKNSSGERYHIVDRYDCGMQ